MRRFWHVATILACAPVPAARAQLQLTAGVGSASLHQSGLPESGVLTFGSDLRVSGSRASLVSSGLGARASDGRATGQALVTGALYAPPDLGPRWQIAATGSAFGLSNDLPTFGAQLAAREYFGGTARGAFVGVGGGGVGRNGQWRSSFTGQGGAWLFVDDDRLLASLSVISTRAEEHTDITGIGDVQFTRPIAYTDLGVGWQRERGPWAIALSGGARAGLRDVARLSGWGSAEGTVWLAPRLAAVAAVGTALADAARGVPGARYASVTMRVAIESHAALSDHAAPLAPGARLTVSSLSDATATSMRRLEVRVPAASSVEVMGDFTQWAPVSLTRTGDAWQVDRAIDAGPHRIAVRVDGGEWRAPVNLPSVDNGFGGTLGLITLP